MYAHSSLELALHHFAVSLPERYKHQIWTAARTIRSVSDVSNENESEWVFSLLGLINPAGGFTSPDALDALVTAAEVPVDLNDDTFDCTNLNMDGLPLFFSSSSNFNGCSFIGATFYYCSFFNASLEACNFTDAKLANSDGIIFFPASVLSGSTFRNAFQGNTNVFIREPWTVALNMPSGANSVRLVDDTDLTDCDMRGIHLVSQEGSSFSLNEVQANFTRVDFTGAVIGPTTFNTSVLEDTNFTSADIRGANFFDCDVSTAIFTDAWADELTIWPPDFDPVAAGVRFVLR